VLCWVGFFFPFVFRAPHWQKRDSVVASGATGLGILFEAAAICIAWYCGSSEPMPAARLAAGMAIGPVGGAVAWFAVRHLGRQFRIRAGLWEDHELIRTGPYAVVRHPIYAALFCELLATLLIVTRWPWWLVSVALFLIGTEIRVATEDRLLASRFGMDFDRYRAAVRAYLPFVR